MSLWKPERNGRPAMGSKVRMSRCGLNRVVAWRGLPHAVGNTLRTSFSFPSAGSKLPRPTKRWQATALQTASRRDTRLHLSKLTSDPSWTGVFGDKIMGFLRRYAFPGLARRFPRQFKIPSPASNAVWRFGCRAPPRWPFGLACGEAFSLRSDPTPVQKGRLGVFPSCLLQISVASPCQSAM